MRHHSPPTLPRANGYTHVVEATAGRTLYVSGQVSLDAAGNVVGAGDFRAQCEQVFANLRAALAAAGAALDHVAKITVFVTDVSQVVVFREVRDRHFTGAPPASSFVGVARLVRPEFMVEVEAIAVIE